MKILMTITAGMAISAATAANATPTLVGITTDRLGVDNIVVDAATYDVIFGSTKPNSFTQGLATSIDTDAALESAGRLVEAFRSFVLRHDYHLEAANFSGADTIEVPEPLTLTFFGAGLAGATAMRRWKMRA